MTHINTLCCFLYWFKNNTKDLFFKLFFFISCFFKNLEEVKLFRIRLRTSYSLNKCVFQEE